MALPLDQTPDVRCHDRHHGCGALWCLLWTQGLLLLHRMEAHVGWLADTRDHVAGGSVLVDGDMYAGPLGSLGTLSFSGLQQHPVDRPPMLAHDSAVISQDLIDKNVAQALAGTAAYGLAVVVIARRPSERWVHPKRWKKRSGQ